MNVTVTSTKKKRFAVSRPRMLIAVALVFLLCGGAMVWLWTANSPRQKAAATPPASSPQAPAPAVRPIASGDVTHFFAHNLRLHQGPAFRVYVQWLRGELVRANKQKDPSFDDPESFYLNVTNGVLRANVGDICNYMNTHSTQTPVRNLKLSGDGRDVKITATLHKLIPLPVQLIGQLQANDGKIQIHVTKIDVLRMPLKGLLGAFHVTLSDFVGSNKVEGLEVQGNDIFFVPDKLLPPPHIRGRLTSVSLKGPDLAIEYGDASQDLERTEQWRNFLRLRDGTIDFGKLTMHKVDLMMIDISQDAWFDLDLTNYQAQLVKGFTRMTPQAGLQIFMPDVSDLKQNTEKDISIQWFKNRDMAPPTDVIPKKK